MAPVTKAPSNTPLMVLLVIFSKVFSNLPPERRSRPLPRADIPYRNKASPPAKFTILKKSIPTSIILCLFPVGCCSYYINCVIFLYSKVIEKGKKNFFLRSVEQEEK